MSRRNAVTVRASSRHRAPGASRPAPRIPTAGIHSRHAPIENADSPVSGLDPLLKEAARSAFHLMGED